MSNFRHWATDSLRDKLQTLPIFVFILYQMDKSSGICIVSPNTKTLALFSRVVLALNSFILLFFWFCFRARCFCVVLDFWMHFIYKCASRVFGILCRSEGYFWVLCFVHVCVEKHLFPPYLFTVDTTRLALIWAMCSISSSIVH
jgi:hypothetical protein